MGYHTIAYIGIEWDEKYMDKIFIKTTIETGGVYWLCENKHKILDKPTHKGLFGLRCPMCHFYINEVKESKENVEHSPIVFSVDNEVIVLRNPENGDKYEVLTDDYCSVLAFKSTYDKNIDVDTDRLKAFEDFVKKYIDPDVKVKIGIIYN